MSSPPVNVWQAAIATLTTDAAVQYLQAAGIATNATLLTLANSSLHESETDQTRAAHWLTIADALATLLTTTAPLALALQAQLAYARARLQLFAGALDQAEALLYQAQAAWQAAGETAGATRALLGLTQVLAMQGRYAEAETAARTAIDAWQRQPPATTAEAIQAAAAHHNLATLFAYTERHSLALAEFTRGRQRLQALESTLTTTEFSATLTAELAHNDLNCATALTFLDQPDAAEAALLGAERGFAQLNDPTNQGRAQTNRGRLYLRTGRYSEALATFDAAWLNLVPASTAPVALDLAQLRQADELLLEQAMAYLVMNLLPEAQQALTRSEALFRSAGQPYELGQTHYTAGLLALRTGELGQAEQQLQAAQELFTDLDNRFWQQRTMLAQAALAQRQGQAGLAVQLVDTLLAQEPRSDEAQAVLSWDLGGLVEARLLRMQLAIEQGSLAEAQQQAAAVATLIGSSLAPSPSTSPLPHYALRLHHALGRLAQAEGDPTAARAHFEVAIALLEATRATLSVEEVRTAFLEDKTLIYEDLVQLLLDLAGQQASTAQAAPRVDAATAAAATTVTPTTAPAPVNNADTADQLLAQAFAVVERARSRTLLERLLAATANEATASEAEGSTAQPDLVAGERESVRQRLHWLYNQLLSESGSRRLNPQLSQDLLAHEATLQRLAWRQSALFLQVQAVDLATFQQTLAPDQQALIYTMVGGKLALFLVDRTTITVYRQLTTIEVVQQAMAELRFQLGRAEVGGDYLARHGARLQMRLRTALATLYNLLVAPVRAQLSAARLLIIPVGELHRLPFHALWDGEAHLLHHFECSYAPSASVAALRQQRAATVQARNGDSVIDATPWHTWAGLAVDDPTIPAARQEVEAVARHFTRARLFLGATAGRAGLAAGAQADILHLATHGLFRADNPFFSALKLADGWVDVRELYRLPLAARLVVLSACESGVGGIRGGDEVVGLVRGFLGAGAAELVATLWNVHDASAADLMNNFYAFLLSPDLGGESRTQRGDGFHRPAAALRAAQQVACAAGLHPYYWAAFFVIGD